MKKICEIIGGIKKYSGDVGVEIEVVGVNLPTNNVLYLKSPSWRKDEDNSLRGFETGEMVLKKPVAISEIRNALEELNESFKYANTEIKESITAGTHVHINVQDLTVKQLIVLTCCYFIIEELLVDWCLPPRRGNHFCLRAKDAEYLIATIIQCLEKSSLNILNTDDIRYSSINFCSLFKYGSLEFRALEGTKDFNRLETWCNILYTLKQNSLKFEEPVDVYNYIINNSYEKFLFHLLSKYANILKSEDWQKKMYNGVILSQDIAYVKDWSIKNLNIFLPNQGGF